MSTEHSLEDLNLSRDEVIRLGEALKDEQFRKLLCEYAEEISNPENMRKAQEEIAMMESERGMNVQFIHPEPGYVLKTTVNGSKKAFINICQNEKIDKPKSQKQTGPDGKTGLLWQIPHSFAPPKDDYDKSKVNCQVFDVVFHPDTYRMAVKNERFKKLVEDTALDGIEHQFGVKLDKNNIKRPKLKFKGLKTATILRERKSDYESVQTSPDDILSQMPYPYDSKTSSEKAAENEAKYLREKDKKASEESKYTEPKYTITHRSHVDLSEYRNAPDAKTSTRPKELVIKVELPLLNSATQVNLDIFEKRLLITSVSPAAYQLDLTLPYPVNDDNGSAKFDKSKRLLIVTLPVISDKNVPLPFTDISDNDKTNVVIIPEADVKSESLPYELKENEVDFKSNETIKDFNESQPCLLSGVEENNEDNSKLFNSNVKWVLPDFEFSQDSETVSFVIKVKNVEESSTKLFFPQTTEAMIQFISYGAGCFPISYSMYIKFSEGCSISSQHSSVDISSENMVFIILKEKEARGLWDTFKVGVDDTKLEVRQFLTDSNLQRELLELDKEASFLESNMPVLVEITPTLSVVKMDEKKLSIEIKPPKTKHHRPEDDLDDEDYEPPSSVEIEVIHKHPTPNLHSILKSRTFSESSEEVNSIDPESPRSEGEELSSPFGKKRSVSFSSHVDHASFKSFASVSSMTPSLKSKRRRQRRRDEKRQGRTRRASEGTSSSEECLHSGEGRSEGSDKPCLSRTLSDPGPNIHAAKESNKRKKQNGNEKGEASANKPESILHNANGLDFRTSNAQECNAFIPEDKCDVPNAESVVSKTEESSPREIVLMESDKNKKIVNEIKSKLAGGDNFSGGHDSDDDDFVDAVSSVVEEFQEKIALTDNNEINGSGEVYTTDKSSHLEKNTRESNGIQSCVSSKEISEVQTMLSWEDEPKNDQQHMTKCPFEFTNSLIYELDMD